MSDKQIRNFSIIAHIDHGKSTLADRLLELTGAIEKRKMRAQVLDAMPLERERGITIKMTPVTMAYHHNGLDYQLNLIDTPGHIDFSYEVSRALKAVEGVILLVDATQGVEAQTLTVLDMARQLNLVIIPVLNKIDSPLAKVEEAKSEISELLGVDPNTVIALSAKTGEGVAALLEAVVSRVPPPVPSAERSPRALIFDIDYSPHQGLIFLIRVFDGTLEAGDKLALGVSGDQFTALEVGKFLPQRSSVASLRAGEIGYVVSGIKEPGRGRVGETIVDQVAPLAVLAGYEEPRPMVWASIYPKSQDDFTLLRQSLNRLRLSDASLSFAEENSQVLGRGFRCGFLGMLHMEIIGERLRREFSLDFIIASPSIGYEVTNKQTGGVETIYSPHLFPEETKSYDIREPWVAASIIAPPESFNGLMKLFTEHEAVVATTTNFGHDRMLISLELPLREMMRHFFDNLKSASSGLASLSYKPLGLRVANVVRLDILVGEKVVPAFSRVVSVNKAETEARQVVDNLAEWLPQQLIIVKIQAVIKGRIVASRSLSARRKDVTGYLYGGDITRKRKLWEKQKKGKKKMQARGEVNIPTEVFLKVVGLK
jgi:GTP-binding protein LepA